MNYLTLVKFTNDPIIYPKDSSWFADTLPDGKLVQMEETTIYTQNTFGLKTLNEQGRISRKEIEGLHLQFNND